jgi:hypothetical protein
VDELIVIEYLVVYNSPMECPPRVPVQYGGQISAAERNGRYALDTSVNT